MIRSYPGKTFSWRRHVVIVVLLLSALNVAAQTLLNKRVSADYKQEKLSAVLAHISKNGGFYFSYNGNIIPKDSLVTLTVNNQPLSAILKQLLGSRFTFEEQQNYIIITRTLPGLSIINADVTVDNNFYSVSGLVVSETSGERLMNASVYEKQQLASVLTDEHGYFKLKFRASAPASIAISASKQFYRDTTLYFLQPVSISSRNDNGIYHSSKNNGSQIERNSLARLFISTRQMIQSMNIPDFFARRPFQVSLTPGLSSHGMFSPQVVNKFSLNLVGGYTAGVNGMEVGGLFNINKQDTRYFQLAGIFNLTGGNVTGVQLAGIHNRSLDTVRGAQLSFFSNKAENQLSGIQLSALHNETRRLKGVQIGLVNVADTSQGVSIGLLNIVRNGFYRVAYTVNDVANTNFALKTGTHGFYSSLLISNNISSRQKLYAFGLGLGHDFVFGKQFYISAEANNYLANTGGSWDDWWLQGKLLLNLQLTPYISLTGGPVYNRYNQAVPWHVPGYKNVTNAPEYGADNFYQSHTKNWIGWEAGIAFNSVFQPAKNVADNSRSWYLGAALTEGMGWDQPYGPVTGGELFVQRDLGDRLTGALTSGYTYIAVHEDYEAARFSDNSVYLLPQHIVPVKAGIRLKLSPVFYIAGDLGVAFGTQDNYTVGAGPGGSFVTKTYGASHSLMYSAGFGLSFKSGFETGLKFEDYKLQSQYKQFALRLGYRFKLGK